MATAGRHAPPPDPATLTALQIPASAVRDSIAAVFRQPAYDRTVRQTVWDHIVSWIGDLFRALFDAVHGSRPVYWTVVTALVVVALAAIARAISLGQRRMPGRAAERELARRRGGARGGRDPWLLAQELSARGDYTEAAHALYRALLEALARRERVRLHPSKTVGDYVRDLRQRSSSLFGRFRDFARSYETVVYGLGTCDRERYERLHALAAPIVQPAGAEGARG